MNCVMANLEKDFPIWGALGSGQVTIWAEQMKASAPGGTPEVREEQWLLDDRPAMITRKLGRAA